MIRRLVAALLAPLLLVLTSCARVQQTVEIRSDKDIRVHMDIGLQKAIAKSARIGPQQICAGYKPGQQGLPTSATVEPYDDGQVEGCRISYTAAVDQLGGMVTHDGRRWSFQLRGSQGAKGVPATISPADIDDFRVAVTFPAKVTAHNGSSTVSGRTVTWTAAADWLGDDGLRASAVEEIDWPLIGAVGIGAQAVIFGLILLGYRLARPGSGHRSPQSMQAFVDAGFQRHYDDHERTEWLRRYYANPDAAGAWGPQGGATDGRDAPAAGPQDPDPWQASGPR